MWCGPDSHDGLEEILEGEVERLGGCKAQAGKGFSGTPAGSNLETEGEQSLGKPGRGQLTEITDDVGQVATPEGANALLAGYTGEAVDDARVAGNLALEEERKGLR